MKPLLVAQDLEVFAGAFRLGPLSLRLEREDYLLLLGPNGAGKSTLLKAIAGFYPVPAGRLFLEGRDLAGLPPHRRGVGYLSQRADLFPHLTVRANVAFGLRYAGGTRAEQKARLERVAGLLGIAPLLRRDVSTLSGGETKRVALARSLAPGPRLLLLDEPLGMLDPPAREELLAALLVVHRELGTAAIHVTHDREEAWRVGGRCAVMHRGRIEETNTVEGLFHEPRTRFVAEFLGGGNLLPARFIKEEEKTFAVFEWGRLPLKSFPDFERGCVQLRPDTLRVARPGETAGLVGTLERAMDRGAYRELIVRLGGKTRLVVHTLAHGEDIPPVGREIRLACTRPPHPLEEEPCPTP
ncbi:MAG: ABC transporter ATP-binding protein [Planctomycetota bacterium]